MDKIIEKLNNCKEKYIYLNDKDFANLTFTQSVGKTACQGLYHYNGKAIIILNKKIPFGHMFKTNSIEIPEIISEEDCEKLN